VVWNDLNFCCNGCKTVYLLLNDNKLYSYYDLEKTPGIRVETTMYGNKYEFLDNEEIRDKLISFSEGGISKVKFYIPVIHCASCIWLLERLHVLHPGIRQSVVNFGSKEVDITFDQGQISLREVVELLSTIHYIPDLSLSLSNKKDTTPSHRKLLYRIGVAGFVFINVMTYSLPAYFNRAPLDDKLQSFLGILSFILVIPVVFYSGSDYYASSLKSLRKKTISIDLPIALGITVLFLVSAYEILLSRGAGYCDSLSGLIFFLLVGKWYQGKTYEALSFERNYKSYFPIAVTRINKQVEESILLEHIDKDDELIIRNKELIPADSILLEGKGRIDYSFVTGESEPVIKEEGDFIYAGGRQMGELIRIRVQKRVSQSHLTELWNQDRSYEKPGGSIKSLSDTISKYFTITIISIASLGFLYWLLHGDTRTAIFVFTAVLIVACPCALALSIPFTFGNTMRMFGKNGLYIKNTEVIERLSHVDTIVFDKTGTLTRPNAHSIDYRGEKLEGNELAALASLARQSTHPLSLALVSAYPQQDYLAPEHFVEVSGRGIFGKVGQLEIRLGSEEYVRSPGDKSGRAEQADRAAQSQIRRASEVHISLNGSYRGAFTISNRYREGINRVLESLDKEFELYLLSGDNDSEAERLAGWFDPQHILFNQKPADKADFILDLQEQGRRVLMTGDGLNDAGALMQSDVAMTLADKVYHFSPASDAVLEADRFPVLARFIRYTRTSVKIVKLSFLISFLYNIVGISFAITGNLSPIVAAILMPVSSVSVVAFATFVTRASGRFSQVK
jgi:Cu+-exporting ATPase